MLWPALSIGLMRRGGGSLGPELLTNGGFSSDTAWNKGTGWTISGGLAVGSAVPAPAAGNLTHSTAAVVAGRRYRTVFTITAFTGGGVSMLLGPTTTTSGFGTARNAVGTYTEDIVTSVSGVISVVRRLGDFTGSVDNVSVREILP